MNAPFASHTYTSRGRAFVEALGRRILVLDGATGTLLQQFGLTEADFRGEIFKSHPQDIKGNNDVLCMTLPDRVAEVHRRYLEAGADMVSTNTFGANRVSQADYGLEAHVYAMNLAAAHIARAETDAWEAAHPRQTRWVLGSIGPTNRTASLSPDADRPEYRAVTFDELAEAYAEQLRGLVDGGADALIFETIFDTLNAKAAIFAVERFFEGKAERLPLLLSATITDAARRTLSGQTLEAFWNSVRHARPVCVGINCALGVEQMRPHVEALSALADCYVSCYPNAGLPNPLSPTGYDETPEHFSQAMAAFAKSGWLNLAGGCCGTMPAHIAALAKAVENIPARKIPAPAPALRLSGLEALTLPDNAPFQMVGERTNVMGSPKFKKAVREGDDNAMLDIARQQVEGGANVIDVNFDEALLDGPACMARFLNLAASEPDIARVPLMIDSSDWAVLEAGLKCSQGKAIVNSLSLKEGEEIFLKRARLCRGYGAAVIVMAFDENGQATARDEKVRVCARAYDLLVKKAGFDPQDIVFDPNVLTVATGMPEHDRYALDFIEAIPEIKRRCPGARVSGGISNVSFSFRGNNAVREAMHAVFLRHAIANGLDMGIVNAGMLANYETIEPTLRERIEDVVLARRPDATERLLELAETLKGAATATAGEKTPAWRALPADERLRQAMVLGVDSFIETDLDELTGSGANALNLIEGPLMDGMRQVGALFGEGKMFLPQIVKSARVMKRAVAHLQPLIEAGKREGARRGKILVATVKGDVHDIGKNIVSVVLSCNGFEVEDLGVMVDCEKIIERVAAGKPDLVGLSGLITPSLEEMTHVAARMNESGFSMPLIVGGATTGERHTAVKIAPAYPNGLVVRGGDASQMAQLCLSLVSPEKREETRREIQARQETLRADFIAQKPAPLVPLEAAREKGSGWETSPAPKPEFLGTRIIKADTSELTPFIRWAELRHAWGVHKKANCPCGHDHAAEDLLADAKAMWERIVREKRFAPRAALAFWSANRDGDDVVVFADDTRQKEAARFHFLRQQTPSPAGQQKCLADFVAPAGTPDYMGGFAVTAGVEAENFAKEFEKQNDPYNALLVQSLADRAAEAAAEWLHQKARQWWGIEPQTQASPPELFKENYRGIRPAIGYPSIPDHTEKRTLWQLLDAENATGISLTDSCAMRPAPSAAGLYFAHPQAKHFRVGPVAPDQLADYAKRKGWPLCEAERWLPERG